MRPVSVALALMLVCLAVPAAAQNVMAERLWSQDRSVGAVAFFRLPFQGATVTRQRPAFGFAFTVSTDNHSPVLPLTIHAPRVAEMTFNGLQPNLRMAGRSAHSTVWAAGAENGRPGPVQQSVAFLLGAAATVGVVVALTQLPGEDDRLCFNLGAVSGCSGGGGTNQANESQ